MRFDHHLSRAFQQQLQATAQKMRDWDAQALIDEHAAQDIATRIQFFDHAPGAPPLSFTGVDGSGEYPLLTYADAFVYLTTAHAATYTTHLNAGLKEHTAPQSLVNLAWLPGAQDVARPEVLAAFEAMTGESITDTIEGSDYRLLNPRHARVSTQDLVERLVIPPASDSGNHAIQLRTVGELGAARRVLAGGHTDYLLYDSTLALPLIRSTSSLFLEHLKRRVCVQAREQGAAFVAVSKSPGLPGMDDIERLALNRARADVDAQTSVAEHWFLRLPVPDEDDWSFPPADGRAVPPPGAVSYLVRFHRNTGVLRIDLDRTYWQTHLRADTDAQTRARERRLFEHLDYAGHDQRAYGYPYPIKAAHDHASLTGTERHAFRSQLIDAAVKTGMNRKLFRNASGLTGHR